MTIGIDDEDSFSHDSIQIQIAGRSRFPFPHTIKLVNLAPDSYLARAYWEHQNESTRKTAGESTESGRVKYPTSSHRTSSKTIEKNFLPKSRI